MIKEMNMKPISIKTLNIRVDTARDLVFKLYNTTKNIINNAYYAENLIVYEGHKGIRITPEGLNKANQVILKHKIKYLVYM